MKLVFLLEEPSMKIVLDELLPKILPEGVLFQTIPHNGKRALERSLPHKLQGWNEPGDICFVIVHDQDTADCKKLKQQLVASCEPSGRRFLVRIVCQELESWYFGDPEALAQVYGAKRISSVINQKKYRVPDEIPNPKEALYRLIPEHQQIEGAARLAPRMSVERNTSQSFQCLVSGVRRMVREMSAG